MSFGSVDDLNPYQSPRSAIDPLYLVAWDPSAKLQSSLVKAHSLYRRVRLAGRLEADIVWNASFPKEYVSDNGRTVAAMHAYFRSVPYFEFELQAADHRFLVIVEVRVVWMYWTKAFRITVDYEIAYAEGDWSKV